MYDLNYCNTRRIKIRDFILKIINNIPIENTILKRVLRIGHHFLPLIQFILVTFGNINLFYIGISIFSTIVFCFLLLNGCILTSVEKKLFGDDYTTADPVLDFLFIRKTKQNRVNTVYLSFIISTIYIIFIYIYRFGKK